MPKQLAFEQPLRHRRTVDRHKGMAAPRALVVQGTRHQFLARAAFALNQDGTAGGGQALQEAKQALHHGTFAEQLAKAIALRPPGGVRGFPGAGPVPLRPYAPRRRPRAVSRVWPQSDRHPP